MSGLVGISSTPSVPSSAARWARKRAKSGGRDQLRIGHFARPGEARTSRLSNPWPVGPAPLLEQLTTVLTVGIFSNMKATLIAQTRIVYSARAFAELVLWRVPGTVQGSDHGFKYRLAYVVDSVCVVRYDNEVGKGDHRHVGETESAYRFSTLERLMADFQADIARWNDENSDPRGSLA